ncbi:hypothetical protein EK21DRAFT_94954 [Setomelanomma holmii]|uniref:Uncharacterized protein n=1 Tax=Setomelanomma holmii TaxID=210430 RepID=A0A9P4GXQ4_9PLEO|nr:hypothetical protein EK21DRAFT_94954 [Setomelanomma holmii]
MQSLTGELSEDSSVDNNVPGPRDPNPFQCVTTLRACEETCEDKNWAKDCRAFCECRHKTSVACKGVGLCNLSTRHECEADEVKSLSQQQREVYDVEDLIRRELQEVLSTSPIHSSSENDNADTIGASSVFPPDPVNRLYLCFTAVRLCSLRILGPVGRHEVNEVEDLTEAQIQHLAGVRLEDFGAVGSALRPKHPPYIFWCAASIRKCAKSCRSRGLAEDCTAFCQCEHKNADVCSGAKLCRD